MQHCGEIRLVARIDPQEACWAGEQQGLSNQLGDGLPMDKDDDKRETWWKNLRLFWAEFNPSMIILDPFNKLTRHQVPWEKGKQKWLTAAAAVHNLDLRPQK